MSEAEIAGAGNDPSAQGPGLRSGKKWSGEIRFTWAVAILICVVPALVYGASFPAGFLLLAVVVFGIPTGLGALLLKDKALSSKLWRRLIVLGSVAFITSAIVSQADKMTPALATPIAEAIAQYRTDTGRYPVALAELSPKHLASLPAVRVALIQPSISYMVNEGQPRLAIPSARGDAFANYEYNFEAKKWAHNN